MSLFRKKTPLEIEAKEMKKKAKTAQKDADRIERAVQSASESVSAMSQANDRINTASDKQQHLRTNMEQEEWFSSYLKNHDLRTAVQKAKDDLYIQRDKIRKRMITLVREYHYYKNDTDYPNRRKEMDRCSSGVKNAAYALSVIQEAIDRLDDKITEYEWQQIMKELTTGYKVVNAISTGSGLFTKLVLLIQKARADAHEDVSIAAMEHYYGKDIETLLSEQNATQAVTQMLVNDKVMEVNSERDIDDAIRKGIFFEVSPDEVAKAAEEQSSRAAVTGGERILRESDTDRPPRSLQDMFDSLPTNL